MATGMQEQSDMTDRHGRFSGAKRALCLLGSLAVVAYAGTEAMRSKSLDGTRDDKLPFEIISVDRPQAQSRRLLRSEEECSLRETDLFLPMQKKDLPLSSTLWKSIEMKLPCFKDLVIIVPPDCREAIMAVAPAYAKVFVVPDPLPEQFGYLSQQVIKLYADQFTSGDYVLVLEADLVFIGWDDGCFLTEDKKVKVRCMRYEHDGWNELYWKKGTEHALGVQGIAEDCVVNTPFLYPRDVFPSLRRRLYEVHNKPFGEFMEDYYEGHSGAWTAEKTLFSEFNILNHFMLEFMPGRSQLVTTDTIQDFWGGEKCSKHTGAMVKRNYDLDNPKLTSEYFELAYDLVKEPREYPEIVVDLAGQD